MKRSVIGVCLRPEFWLWLLLTWLSVSALRSLHTFWLRSALTEGLRWGAGIGLALAFGRWLTQTRLVAQMLTVCTGLIAMLGIWDGLIAAHGGMVGPFRDHQLCGSALLVLLPICVATALTNRDIRWRWGAQGVVLAAMICLVMTETRGAWIGAGVSGLTFAGLWWYRVQGGADRRVKKQWLVSLLLVIAVCLSFCVGIGATELQRVLSARVDTLSALGHDTSWQSRLSAWHGAKDMILAHPITGWGLGRYPDRQWPFTHEGRVLTPTDRPSLSEQAHSLYLQTTAETGLVGMLLLLAALTTFVGQSLAVVRHRQRQPLRSRDGFLITTMALIAGFAIDALASPSYQFPEVSLFLWAGLGIGLAALNGREQSETQTLRVPAPVLRLGRLATSGALVLLVLSQFVPLGLLVPVAAYDAPGYTYQLNNPPVISPPFASATPGDGVPFTMTAHYTNNATGSTENVDVTTDSTTVFNASSGLIVYSSGFGAGGTTKNVFTVPATQANGQPWVNGAQITISGYFYDSAHPALKNNATTAMLTIRVTSP